MAPWVVSVVVFVRREELLKHERHVLSVSFSVSLSPCLSVSVCPWREEWIKHERLDWEGGVWVSSADWRA